MEINSLLKLAIEMKASDLHLMGGSIPRVRLSGDLVELDLPPVSSAEIRELLRTTAPKDFEQKLDQAKPVEWNRIEGGMSFSGIAHSTEGEGIAATFRIFSNQVPTLDQIGMGLEPVTERVLSASKGIAIFAGVTGSGKWTVVGSIIDAINSQRPVRIFVVTEGANFVYEKAKGLVTQLFVGQDCESYETALQIAYGSDPDVIAFDDVTNQEVLRQALLLAETGHLVIFNFHAPDPVSVIERMIETAGLDAQPLLRSLAKNLIVVNSQRLVQRKDKPGRSPIYQWIFNTPKVKEALLLGDLALLRTLQEEEPDNRTEREAWEYMINAGYVEPNALPAYPNN